MIFDRLFGGSPSAATPPADADFWYTSAGTASLTGVTISTDTALAISAVWACVNAISQDIAKIPLFIYRRLPNGGRERAPNHPLYELLHTQPNAWQTSYQWRQQMIAHLLLRGNFYNELIAGPRGFADQLIPIHPDQVTLEQPAGGGLQYRVREVSGQTRIILPDAMMHMVGLSLDGVRGVSVIQYARETMGLALATEQYAALQFGKAPRPAGVLRHPGKLGETAAKNLATSFERAHTGPQNWQRVAVLEEGMEFQTIGISAKDAQYLESRQFQVPEVARWFRVPLHKIQDLSRATFTNIEQQSIEYVTDTLTPWCANLEQVFARDLILFTDTYFAEFLLAGLMRGDAAARSTFYNAGVSHGWLTRNEVRALENLNPLPGLDEPLTPMNITGRPRTAPASDSDSDDDEAQARTDAPRLPATPSVVVPSLPLAVVPVSPRVMAIVTEAAARVVRREIQAATKAALRYAADAAGWRAWLVAFYDGHGVFVAETLKLSLPVAQAYAAHQADRLRAGGLATAADWEWTVASELAALALHEAEEAAS